MRDPKEAFEILMNMLEHAIQIGPKEILERANKEGIGKPPVHIIAYDRLGLVVGRSVEEGNRIVLETTDDAWKYASPIRFELTDGDGRKVEVTVASQGISRKQKAALDAGATPEQVGIHHFNPTHKH